MQIYNTEIEEHLMSVICEFEISYHFYKISVGTLIIDCYFSALKMFSKYEQRCFIKIETARGKNARQYHTALLDACGRETLPYRTVAIIGQKIGVTDGVTLPERTLIRKKEGTCKMRRQAPS